MALRRGRREDTIAISRQREDAVEQDQQNEDQKFHGLRGQDGRATGPGQVRKTPVSLYLAAAFNGANSG